MKTTLQVVTTITLMTAVIYADSNTTDDVQDMSDPLAVYTQAGVGITNKGINFKVGQAYDTGNPSTMGMNIIEIKGIAGETLGGGKVMP